MPIGPRVRWGSGEWAGQMADTRELFDRHVGQQTNKRWRVCRPSQRSSAPREASRGRRTIVIYSGLCVVIMLGVVLFKMRTILIVCMFLADALEYDGNYVTQRSTSFPIYSTRMSNVYEYPDTLRSKSFTLRYPSACLWRSFAVRYAQFQDSDRICRSLFVVCSGLSVVLANNEASKLA